MSNKLALILTITETKQFVKLELEGLNKSIPITRLSNKADLEKLIRTVAAFSLRFDPSNTPTDDVSEIIDFILAPKAFREYFGRQSGMAYQRLLALEDSTEDEFKKVWSCLTGQLSKKSATRQPWACIFNFENLESVQFHSGIMQDHPVRLQVIDQDVKRDATNAELQRFISHNLQYIESKSNPPTRSDITILRNGHEADTAFAQHVIDLAENDFQFKKVHLLQYSGANIENPLKILLTNGADVQLWIADPELVTNDFQRDRIQQTLSHSAIDWVQIAHENGGSLQITCYKPDLAVPRAAWIPDQTAMLGMYLKDPGQGHAMINGHKSPTFLITADTDGFDSIEDFVQDHFERLTQAGVRDYDLSGILSSVTS